MKQMIRFEGNEGSLINILKREREICKLIIVKF